MKKLIYLFSVLLISSLVIPAFSAAVSNRGTTLSPSGNRVKNQNQIKTQNQDKDNQIQVESQEQKNLEKEPNYGSKRSQIAREHMSTVAQKVEELLQVKTQGGIGEQVKEIAKEQSQTQDKIQEHLNKADSRDGLAKLLMGPDYRALKNIKQQLEQNQRRVKQLKQLQNQLSNQGDITMIQETTQALLQENTSLQDKISAEEKAGSLFGWLFKLFTK